MLALRAEKSPKPKIYITALHLQHGGVELAISLQANALVARDFPVCLLVIYNLGEPAYPLDQRVEIRYLTSCRPNREAVLAAWQKRQPFTLLREGVKAAWTLWQKTARLKKVVKGIREGVLVSTRHEHSLLLSRYAHASVHLVAQLHHDHRFDPKLLKEMVEGYKNIDDFALLLPSLKAEAEALLRPKNRWTRIHAIGNFLPQSLWIEPEKALHFDQREDDFLWVGRLASEKNPLDALLIFREFLDRAGENGRNYRLHFYGDGPLSESLLVKTEELLLTDQVIFHGMCAHDEILHHMRKAKALLLTSDTEGLAFVMLEAFASALPVFAYDVRVAPRDLLIHERTGFLFPLGDTSAYAQMLVAFIRNADLYAYVVAGGYQVLREYDECVVMKAWEDIYLRRQEPQPEVLPLFTLLRKTCRLSYEKFVAAMEMRVQSQAKATLVITINPEMLTLAKEQPRFYELFFRPQVYLVPDGMGVVKVAKKIGLPIQKQIPGVELCDRFLALADQHAWRVFLYGGKPEVMEALVAKIKANYPRAEIVGAFHGYGQNEEDLIRQVVQQNPDLVFAALGCPRQEFFLANCQTEMQHGLLMGVGGSFDVLSGSKKRAPLIFHRLGLEWAYRLLCEPKRIPRFVRGNLPYLRDVWLESRRLRRSWRVQEVPLTAQESRAYLYDKEESVADGALQTAIKTFLEENKLLSEENDV